jgi:hypothetical protein
MVDDKRLSYFFGEFTLQIITIESCRIDKARGHIWGNSLTFQEEKQQRPSARPAGWHGAKPAVTWCLPRRVRANLTVPLHSELSPGTLRALIRVASLTVDEFLALL